MGALLDPVTSHTLGFREMWRKVVVKCIVIMMNRTAPRLSSDVNAKVKVEVNAGR